MGNKTDCELIRVQLKNMANAYKLYREQIKILLQRIEGREQ